MYLYVKTRVLRLIFRVLDVPKGLRARPHQRGRLRALKNEVLGFWNSAYVCRFGAVHACMLSTRMLLRNPNFDNFDGPNSNGNNALNINPN